MARTNKKSLFFLLLIFVIITSCTPPSASQTQIITTPTIQSQMPDCEATDTGFCWPTGKIVNKPYNWMANNCGWSEYPTYKGNKYHIGVDIKADIGDPVYAIADGVVRAVSRGKDSGWQGDNNGENNVGVIVEQTLSDGTKFIAVYGHVVLPGKDPTEVIAGESFATIGPYNKEPHLHFGIRPGTSISGALGRLDCPQPLGTSSPTPIPIKETSGFVDPIDWITTKSPLRGSVLGATAVYEENPTPTAPIPVPGATPIRNLTPTPTAMALSPLDTKDYYSVLQWIKYAMANSDATVFQKLVSGEINYVNYIEGGDPTSEREFLAHLTDRISSNARCDYFSFDQGYSSAQNEQVGRLQIWTSGWSPAWEMDQLCYVGCEKLSTPVRSTKVGFFFLDEKNGWRLNTVWVNDIATWQSINFSEVKLIDCDHVQTSPQISSTPISSNLLSLNQAEYFSVLQWIRYSSLFNDISVFEKLIIGNSIQSIDGRGNSMTINKADFLAELSKRLLNKPNCEYFMFEESGRLIIRISNWSPSWDVGNSAVVYLILELLMFELLISAPKCVL